MSAKDIVLGADSGGAATPTYVDDVFSTYLYTGNGSTQTINNGIDLAGKGGMVWSATRVGAENNGPEIIDTNRGGSYRLLTSLTQAAYNCSDPITFNTNGFSMSPTVNTYINYSGFSKVAWTFRKAAKFFDVVTYTGNGVAGRQIAHSINQEVGLILLKSTSLSGDWNTYHRSLNGSLKLNSTEQQSSILDTAITTIGASATLSSTVKKFGTSSWQFTGNADSYLEVAASTANKLTSNTAFTIECWINPSSTQTAAYPGIFDIAFPGQSDFRLFTNHGSYPNKYYLNTNQGDVIGTATISYNTWSHVAVVYNANTLKVYINGTLDITLATSSDFIPYSSPTLIIGGANWNSNTKFTGYIDDFRITKGVARYTSNFTPTTTEFPFDSTDAYIANVYLRISGNSGNSIITSASDTTFTVSSAVNTPNVNYVAYLFAHDTAADGIIQCGMATYPTSGDVEVNLGWQPQYVLYKDSGHATDWNIFDTMRGWSAQTTGGVFSNSTGGAAELLYANTATAGTATYGSLTSTGFKLSANDNYGDGNTKVIYMAIRRPNKPPTSGTQVYNAIARTGTGAVATVTGVGFAPDLVIGCTRNYDGWYSGNFFDRLRGNTKRLTSVDTIVESTVTNCISSFGMDGVIFGADTTQGYLNFSAINYINHFFKRAPGFMDVVCYTGTGSSGANAIPHNLTVEPELVIVKSRTTATYNEWYVYNKYSGNGKTLHLNGGYLAYNFPNWGNTSPTTNVFTVNASYTNDSQNYVAYLFATLAGISKVGSYTGNGSTQTINCGFAAGARFILIKRTDAAGDWYVWDTARGIAAANDPHLSLNSTAAEVTTDDSIDPASTGFVVNQVAATNINVTSATYIFLAIA